MAYVYGVSSTSSRVSGLVSGLDTETMVKGMTSTILSKITKLEQSKQVFEWKTEAYRGISSQMTSFSNKYLSFTSSSNALNDSFYVNKSTNALGANADKVRVTGNSALADLLTITDIKSTARTAGFVSSHAVASGSITTGTIDFTGPGTLKNNLAGQTININYGGELFDLKIDATFAGNDNATVAAAINAALADVTYGSGTLADVLQAQDMGGHIEFAPISPIDANTLEIVGGSGNSLSILGIVLPAAGTGGVPINAVVQTGLIESLQNFGNTVAGKTVSFSYNGTRKDITIPAYSATFLDDLQAEFDTAFGANRVRVGRTASDELTFTAVKMDGGVEKADPTSTLQIVAADTGLAGSGGLFGITVGMSNRVELNAKLEDGSFTTPLDAGGVFDIKINGITFNFTAADALTDIIKEINDSAANVKLEYLPTTNTFSVTSTIPGASGAVDIQDLTGNLGKVLFGVAGSDYTINAGKDAEIEISYDGGNTTTTVIRSTNVFEIDGITLTVVNGAENTFVAGDAITFESVSNTDDVLKNIQGLVDAYNAIYDLTNMEVGTSHNRKYPPLTDEQREKMTDKQIELWEEEAMKGLLFNDSTLRALASELRHIFSFSVPGVGSIKDFGISLESENQFKDGGKIVIDEEVLRKAIEERGDELAALFTTPKAAGAEAGSADQGIIFRLKDVMDKYVATTGEHKGTLLNIAGMKDNVLFKDNQMQREIDKIDEQLEKLQRQLSIAQDRYYRQFTQLEKYMAQMNSQASWLMGLYE